MPNACLLINYSELCLDIRIKQHKGPSQGQKMKPLCMCVCVCVYVHVCTCAHPGPPSYFQLNCNTQSLAHHWTPISWALWLSLPLLLLFFLLVFFFISFHSIFLIEEQEAFSPAKELCHQQADWKNIFWYKGPSKHSCNLSIFTTDCLGYMEALSVANIYKYRLKDHSLLWFNYSCPYTVYSIHQCCPSP